MDDKNKKDANALGVTNVGGVFVVLVGGIIVGCFVAMCEFLWKARKNAKEDKVCFQFPIYYSLPTQPFIGLELQVYIIDWN